MRPAQSTKTPETGTDRGADRPSPSVDPSSSAVDTAARRDRQRRYEAGTREFAEEVAPGGDQRSIHFGLTLLRAANRLQRDLDVGVHRPSGVSWAGYRVLFAIRALGVVHPKDLARFSSVSTASISRVIDTLEATGYVRRERDSADRRATTVRLTASGNRAIEELYRRNLRREREWAAALSDDEMAQLLSLLGKLIIHRPRSADPVEPL